MSEWKYEPPARPGDFVASISKDESARRHWNGANWSAPWYVGDPPDIVNRARNTPAEAGGSPIAWVKFADDVQQTPQVRVYAPERRYMPVGRKVFGPGGSVVVCECTSDGDAITVAAALNAYEFGAGRC